MSSLHVDLTELHRLIMDEEALDTECPVCYESFANSARTLSCGHAFCHDCLVGTFVGSIREGAITRDSIICPVCRHVTFVNKLPGPVGEKGKFAKILEVPLKPAVPTSSGGQSFRTGGCLKWFSHRLNRQKLVFPKDSLQVFIISDLGRPIAEEDIIDVGTAVIRESSARRRCTPCSTSHFLVFLLIIFTLLALVAATMPWILLA